MLNFKFIGGIQNAVILHISLKYYFANKHFIDQFNPFKRDHGDGYDVIFEGPAPYLVNIVNKLTVHETFENITNQVSCENYKIGTNNVVIETFYMSACYNCRNVNKLKIASESAEKHGGTIEGINGEKFCVEFDNAFQYYAWLAEMTDHEDIAFI